MPSVTGSQAGENTTAGGGIMVWGPPTQYDTTRHVETGLPFFPIPLGCSKKRKLSHDEALFTYLPLRDEWEREKRLILEMRMQKWLPDAATRREGESSPSSACATQLFLG